MTTAATKLIMLPGLDGTGRMLADAAKLNWNGMQPTPLALPTRGPQDYDRLVKLFAAELPEERFVLLAESFSAPLAIRLAKLHAERVRALVLISGFCSAPQSQGLGWLPLRPLFALTPPAFFLRRFLVGPDAPAKLVKTLGQTLRKVPAGVLADRLRAGLALRARDCPPARNIPTLLLQARRDAVIPWEAQSRLERHMPHATVEWIDGPHMLLQTRPEDCRRAVLGFLNG